MKITTEIKKLEKLLSIEIQKEKKDYFEITYLKNKIKSLKITEKNKKLN